ncbi:MAG: hypothetical protein ITG00_08675 [Flavobacterium sp.]|nr:hypothetical protein [Flavobacterium sp.]
MIKKIVAGICLLFSFVGAAQEGSSSPYSYYGIGEVRFKGTAENRAMGGLMIFPDSIHMNIQNPASYPSLRLTTFTVGGTYSSTNMETETQQSKARRTTLDYFAVGLPMGKLGVSFGLVPYSSVGYKISSEEIVGGVMTSKRATGSGGVNRAFLGAGYQITPKFSVGADFAYNFGKIETSSIQRTEGVQLGSRELNTSLLSGASFNAGVAYQTKFNEKLQFFSALTYSFEGKLRSRNEREIATVQFLALGGEVVSGEPIIFDPGDSELRVPGKLTFGAGIGQLRKWGVGAEISLHDSADQSNRFVETTNTAFENAIKYNFGGYYIPNYSSYTNYFSKITYRAGLRYETTGLVIQNKSIEDAAMSLGLGFPIGGGTFSNINIGFEYGKRGTVYGGLVEENYANFFIGLSFNDRWFVKRKYD